MSELPSPDLLPSRPERVTLHSAVSVQPEPGVWNPVGYDDRAWRRSAACRHEDPAAFFPVGITGTAIQEIADAKAVCHRCPVRLACLRFALVSHQEFGVWGGHDEEERRELRRQWRRLGRPFPIMRGVHAERDALPPGAQRVDRAG
jgi:WhiB family redox-sensing transcriptional regulator